MSSPAISERDLVAYAAGTLPAAEAARIESALRRDPGAGAFVDHFRAVCRALQGEQSMPLSEEVIARARALLRTQERAAPDWREWLERPRAAVARLVFDSRVQPVVSGLRGGSERFAAVWESDAAEIEIEASLVAIASGPRSPRRWQVLGQVTASRARPRISVALLRPGIQSPVAEASADESGMFRVEAPTERYDLVVRLDDAVVIAPNLDLA